MKWALDGDVLTLPRALEVINELKSKPNWYFHYFSSPYAPRSWQSKCSMTVFYCCIYTGSAMWREANSFQKFTKAVFIVTWRVCPCPSVLSWSCENNHFTCLRMLEGYKVQDLLLLFNLVFVVFCQYIGFFCSRLFNHPPYFSIYQKQMIVVHVMLLSCTLVHFSALHLYFHF